MFFMMKEHLSNSPSIRLDYDLLVFSFRYLLSKLTVCDIEKANFQICIQSWSTRMRVHHLKVTCVQSLGSEISQEKESSQKDCFLADLQRFFGTLLYLHFERKDFLKSFLVLFEGVCNITQNNISWVKMKCFVEVDNTM